MSKSISARYYEENKESLPKELMKDTKKEKKQQYGRERYKNLSEDEKQKLVEYNKRNCRMRKNVLL